MQKIKYPVGSKLKSPHFSRLITIGDLSKNEFLAAVFWAEDNNFIGWLTQENIDDCYTLASTPRWTPEIGEEYFTMYNDGSLGSVIWKGDKDDLFRLKNDNVKRTSEECQKKIDEINSREI